MQVNVAGVERLRFTDGSAVRAASAVARLGEGFLVAQDDATHAAWVTGGAATAVRVLPAVAGLDVFDEATGTKHLKPDLEAACPVRVAGEPAILLLGSGSTPARMRSSVVRLVGGQPSITVADLSLVYAAVAQALGVHPDVLNMEGACIIGDTFRWFHRGLPSAGLPSASVDLEVAGLLAAVLGDREAATVQVGHPRTYDLGDVDGVGLAVTDAVALSGDRLLVSAAAEDTPNPRDDGPVVGSALVRLDGHEVVDVTRLPEVDGAVCKVEGLMVLEADQVRAELLAVVDVDDPDIPSLAVRLDVQW
ncbi:MAG: hypothetical protein AVDCRST_MAG34-2669 [uncultured Nocardioidaceae bacterium]|uniref:Uncharacterized protein n=1 Tax=uncultured Nocardioidaceae bacterium TaxID=253824 RepID=A0A6J4MQW6_9ACTN|nr:MAG: hypothetical protein AVDCRST_MAG34-2669 [uncultured Nocardioidaceae bacterium]